MAEEEHRRRGHDEQLKSDGDRGERRGEGQEESNAKKEGWSGGSEGDLAEEMEENGMPKWEEGGSGDTLMVLTSGTQERGAGGLQVGTQVGRSNNSKFPSAAANNSGTQGCHSAR